MVKYNFTILTILSVQFHGIKYTHIIVQLSPLSISRTYSSPQNETLYPLSNNFPVPSSYDSTLSLLIWQTKYLL